MGLRCFLVITRMQNLLIPVLKKWPFDRYQLWPKLCGMGSQALIGYKLSVENYRANAKYEYYENYGIEFSYAQPLGNNWQFSSKYAFQDKTHDDDYPLFGDRNDRLESLRFNLLKPFGS